MNMQSHHSKAERFGQWLGFVWRGYRSRERQIARWLIEHGLPPALAIGGLWLVKLLMLGILLYAAFWLVLMIIVVMAAGAASQKPTDSRMDEEPEWRVGASGYGLYRGDVRIDAGDLFEDD